MNNECTKEIQVKESSLLTGLAKIITILNKIGKVSRWANLVGLITFFLMILFNFVNVILRYFFNRPIIGDKEITSVLLVVVVGLGIAYTQSQKGHVTVDIITNFVSSRVKLIMNTITSLIGIGLFAIILWRSIVQFIWFWQQNTINTYTIQIPSAPFEAVILLGLVLMLLLLIRDFTANLIDCIKQCINIATWLMMLGIFVVVVALGILWMQPGLWEMNLATVGILGVVVSLIFLFSGMPISFALILSSFLFIGHIRGVATAFDTMGTTLYATFSNYLWAVLAFFVIMGFFCLWAKFGEDLYRSAHKWIGHISGGLGIATIAACTAMASIVGDTLSVVSTMATVALPEMKKFKYNDGLSTGAVAAGATIGPMIPPSMGFIMYGIITQQSIGKLFIAGIIPGILLALAFSLTIYIQCRKNPLLGPPSEKSSWKDRFVSLKAGGPVVVLFLLVIGGIYVGAFTPTEGGAVGAAGALIIGLFMRRLNKEKIMESLLGAGKIIAMVFLIIYGATLMTRFIAWCNLGEIVRQSITALSLPHFAIALLIFLVFFILGFIIDIMPIFLIGIPIFHPIMISMGYDPIWVALELTALIQLGLITPPVATNLFAIKGVAQTVPISVIYKGIWPFVMATLSVVIILFLLPGVVTWLPNLLYR